MFLKKLCVLAVCSNGNHFLVRWGPGTYPLCPLSKDIHPSQHLAYLWFLRVNVDLHSFKKSKIWKGILIEIALQSFLFMDAFPGGFVLAQATFSLQDQLPCRRQWWPPFLNHHSTSSGETGSVVVFHIMDKLPGGWVDNLSFQTWGTSYIALTWWQPLLSQHIFNHKMCNIWSFMLVSSGYDPHNRLAFLYCFTSPCIISLTTTGAQYCSW